MEKTEKPTPHRLKKAREEGQSFSSRPFESYIKILIGISCIYFFSKDFLKAFQNYFLEKGIYSPLSSIAEYKFLIVFSLFFGITIAFVMSGINILLPFFYRENNISSNIFKKNISNYFKNINPAVFFSKEKLIRIIFTLVKVITFLTIMVFIIKSNILYLPQSLMIKGDSFSILVIIIKKIIISALTIGLLISILDVLYEKQKFIKSLYMTKQEVKEEFKNQEGDPEIKAKQKNFRRMILFSDITKDVKRAKFLLVNPTHIAIPVIYSENEDAPTIGFLGLESNALQMIQIAKTHSIPIVKNIRLAREFYRIYEPGDQINEEHYEIIASIISFITTLENKIDYIDMDH